MRYIYYIIFILVGITIAAGWGIFSDTKVEFSRPVIVINDRIITESEFGDLIKSKPSYQTEVEFIDSVITKELLIQEAIKHNINKDESFRASVEDFYEQSLIKILMDNQYEKYDPTITDEEIEKYKILASMKVFISKMTYAKKEDVKENKSKNIKTIESDFLDLSGSLRFTVFNLEPGESSKGMETIEGFVIYNLIKTEQIKDQKIIEPLDNDRIIEFLKGGKEEELLAQWVDGLKEKAEIWRAK
jgi:hypothetical protein